MTDAPLSASAQTDLAQRTIAIIGLGYVGLPLAVYFARNYTTIGFDIDATRIADLQDGNDRTNEVTDAEFAAAQHLTVTDDPDNLAHASIYIVTVPTPIDSYKQPDLTALKAASRMVGTVIAPGDIVIYESTVFPGATEDICIPLIEQASGLTFNHDFFAGYSPERINPGDHAHRLPDILKITSGSTPEVADTVDALYASIITAGTHKAPTIRVAEAAKVIENVQRDLNIALVNELALLFKRMDVETRDVLAAAGTKWNFHPYQPGLVGGHCIGVDPYYLTHKAQSIGFHPEIILAGRRINDAMAERVASDILRTMIEKDVDVRSARVLVMGITFKEDCPDTRNTKVIDLVRELGRFIDVIDVYDPHADPAEVREEYGIQLLSALPDDRYDGLVLAVKHREIAELPLEKLKERLTGPQAVIYDVKGMRAVEESDARLL